MIHRLLGSVLFVFAFCVTASAEGWVLHRADGYVRVSTDGKSWSRVEDGTDLASGTWIKTGGGGRAIVGRGAERIIYRPNTLAAISVSQPTGQITQVTHERGSVFLSVITSKRKRSTVVTPHLAAVVKGTVLEVTTDDELANVRVDKGEVEVRSDGEQVNIRAGSHGISSGASISIVAAKVTSRVEGAPNTFSTELRPLKTAPAPRN